MPMKIIYHNCYMKNMKKKSNIIKIIRNLYIFKLFNLYIYKLK